MKYAAITGENFYFNEMKSTCNFLLKGKYNIEEIDFKDLLKKNDILDCKSEYNFAKKFMTINKRIKVLTPNMMQFIVDNDIKIGKFLNLYTILCNERFIAEFMDEVVRDKYMNLNYVIDELDFNMFLKHKEEQSEIVNNWSDSGKKKMIVKVKNFLLEGGYVHKNKDGSYKILKPIIEDEVLEEIRKNGNEKILKIMLY